MLSDLTIQNYRCFEDFHMNGLERVNLFVGNNNSGKTSLLEAIYLLVSSEKSEALLETINNRADYFLNNNTFFYSIKHLFYAHQLIGKKIEIKSSYSTAYLSSLRERQIIIDLTYPEAKATDVGEHCPCLNCFEIIKIVGKHNITDFQRDRSFTINVDNKEYLKIDKEYISQKKLETEANVAKDIFVSISRLYFEQAALMWDTIVLTSKEVKIIEALRIIDRNIERISFSSSNTNQIRLKLSNSEFPIPLSSMGEGMYRILVLAMSLVTAQNRVLLVDEIETGLHYEAQTDMWRLILETARELNVQVFATTHSWDCIAAYQEALSQVEDSSIGKLFRLDSKYGKLRAVEYDAEDLEVVTREGIEVR